MSDIDVTGRTFRLQPQVYL